MRRLGAALGIWACRRARWSDERELARRVTDPATYAAGAWWFLSTHAATAQVGTSATQGKALSSRQGALSALALRGHFPTSATLSPSVMPRRDPLDSLLRSQLIRSEAESERRSGALNRDVLATIVYTSGTTGEPKGAMLTHGNILANLEGIDPVFRLDENDDFLSFLPLSHIFERTAGYYLAIRNASAIYYAESVFTVERTWCVQ